MLAVGDVHRGVGGGVLDSLTAVFAFAFDPEEFAHLAFRTVAAYDVS